MNSSLQQQDTGKRAAGYAAADLIPDHSLVGLGTGSTVRYFLTRLAERRKEGLRFEAVSTSVQSQTLAESLGIPVRSMDGVTQIDITVDGADEIDPLKRMIKGGGGALLREKIVAASSREMLVIIDEKKCVETLGAFPLPIEILPFGAASTIRRLQELLPHGSLRQRDGADYVSDNGNHIWDAQLPTGSIEVEPLHRELLQVPGVIDTGFFIGLAGRVIIGMTDGSVKILP